jgi:hypothetical protein
MQEKFFILACGWHKNLDAMGFTVDPYGHGPGPGDPLRE